MDGYYTQQAPRHGRLRVVPISGVANSPAHDGPAVQGHAGWTVPRSDAASPAPAPFGGSDDGAAPGCAAPCAQSSLSSVVPHHAAVCPPQHPVQHRGIDQGHEGRLPVRDAPCGSAGDYAGAGRVLRSHAFASSMSVTPAKWRRGLGSACPAVAQGHMPSGAECRRGENKVRSGRCGAGTKMLDLPGISCTAPKAPKIATLLKGENAYKSMACWVIDPKIWNG